MLETANVCDECNGRMYEGENIYCVECYVELKNQIEKLEQEIVRLQKEEE